MNRSLVVEKLESLGLELPAISLPGGNYVSVNIRRDIAYVAIQFPILNGDFLYQGILGEDLSTESGIRAMEICAINVLAQIDDKVGFENLVGLNHIDAYFRSQGDWDEAPLVVDGASNLFMDVLGDLGLHSRAIIGVDRLPRNFCVALTSSFTLKG